TGIHTIVANLDGNVLTPVDKAYLYSQQLRMLDMYEDVIPGRNTDSWATAYETNYALGTAYTQPDTAGTTPNTAKGYEVRALSNTVYYTVYKGIGTDTTVGTGLNNVVVRSYTGYNNVPSINKNYIEDVYAVGAKAQAADGHTYYAAQVVVIELNSNYQQSRRDSEQVFIPDFSEVTNNVGIENVTMIRGNGEIDEVAVDMSKSRFVYNYDPANGTTDDNRRAGLYYMDPSDSDPNVYVVERMSSSQIRADNYMAGYVRESYAVLANNYAQVDMMVRPGNYSNGYWYSGFGSNASPDAWTTAQNTRPLSGSANGLQGWQSKAVTADSKTYTYGGSTATLVAADPAVVLSQGGNGDAGTTVSGLNERWDGANAPDNAVWPCTQANFNTINLNEVLVRYDANGNVIWAVSFNETDSAQAVWWNCLPAATERTGLSFWGNRDDNADKRIEISHNQVVAGSKFIDFGNALGTTIENYQIYPVVDGVVSTTPMTRTEEINKTAPGLGREEYQVVVIRSTNGTREVYTLVKLAAVGGNTLTVKTGLTHGHYFDTNDLTGRTLLAPPKDNAGTVINQTIKDYIESFEIPAGATVEWTFTTNGGTVFTVTSDRNNWNLNNDNINSGVNTTQLSKIVAVVTAENDTKVTYTSDAASLITVTLATAGTHYSLDNGTTWKTDKASANDTIKVSAGTVVNFKNTTTGQRFHDTADTKKYADGDAYTVTGTTTITFEAYPSFTVNAQAGWTHSDKITVGSAVTFTKGGVQTLATIQVAEGYEITSEKAAAAGFTFEKTETVASGKRTWNMVGNVDNLTGTITIDDLIATLELNEAQEELAQALTKGASYKPSAIGGGVIELPATTIANNVKEFSAITNNVLGLDSIYGGTGMAYGAMSADLTQFIPEQYRNALYRLKITQYNDALALYKQNSSDPTIKESDNTSAASHMKQPSAAGGTVMDYNSYIFYVQNGRNVTLKIELCDGNGNAVNDANSDPIVYVVTIDTSKTTITPAA
ncbi:MAG: hypothetical protein HFF67_10090, partial [Oscillospiraceae bacterium]|nr:hypothetical protein [Oscillospiraceae bacterium]